MPGFKTGPRQTSVMRGNPPWGSVLRESKLAVRYREDCPEWDS